MTLAEKLVIEFNNLSEVEQKEVVDFVGYLKHKKEKEISMLMDEVIVENEVALRKLSK